jgi:tRNA pseudouridine55 synthase
VYRVKKLLNPEKVGHGGTLDPLACGILPIALGEATKTFAFVADHTKTYRFTAQWGEERSTDDAEGELTRTSSYVPDEAELRQALATFTGTILQQPPAFSALKVNGKRAYDLARAGEVVELASRPVEIHRLSLEQHSASASTFEVTCGKGTYIRSLCRDIARYCGGAAYVSMLERTKVGFFSKDNAISLDKLAELLHNPPTFVPLLPVHSVLDDIPALEFDSESVTLLRQGQAVFCHSSTAGATNLPSGQQVSIMCQGSLVAVGEVIGDRVKPVRVFNL